MIELEFLLEELEEHAALADAFVEGRVLVSPMTMSLKR
jgi:hypothetical protein